LKDALSVAGRECERVGTSAWIFDQYDPAEVRTLGRRGEDRLGELLHAGVDAPGDGDPREQALPGALKLATEQVPRDDAQKDDDDESEEYSDERDGRRILDAGQDELDEMRQQEIVEPLDDRGDGPNRDADRCEKEDSGDEITPDGFA
jgi:hypothetical protein